eukprot:6694324-Prymnesium_polylepis.2
MSPPVPLTCRPLSRTLHRVTLRACLRHVPVTCLSMCVPVMSVPVICLSHACPCACHARACLSVVAGPLHARRDL